MNMFFLSITVMCFISQWDCASLIFFVKVTIFLYANVNQVLPVGKDSMSTIKCIKSSK